MYYYTTKKATGICKLILKIATFRSKIMDDGEGKWWTIYNPFKMQIQTLAPQQISIYGRLYKHEINGHEKQLERTKEKHPRTGTLRYCVGIVANIIIFSYNSSPLEIEAKAAELL